MLKAFFILKIFKFLSQVVGSVKRKFMTSQTGKQIMTIHILRNFSKVKATKQWNLVWVFLNLQHIKFLLVILMQISKVFRISTLNYSCGWSPKIERLTEKSSYLLSELPALPAGIYLPKVSNESIRTRCKICWKLTIKAPARRRSDVFIVKFEHISHLVLVSLLLTLNMQFQAGLCPALTQKQVLHITQRRIQNPVKHQRWNILQK